MVIFGRWPFWRQIIAAILKSLRIFKFDLKLNSFKLIKIFENSIIPRLKRNECLSVVAQWEYEFSGDLIHFDARGFAPTRAPSTGALA